MSFLVHPPDEATDIARTMAGGYFSIDARKRTIEVTSEAAPIYMFEKSTGFDEDFDPAALRQAGWMFFVYVGGRPVGTIDIADQGNKISFSDLTVERTRELRNTIRILDDYIDNRGYCGLGMIREPVLNSSFYWLQGNADLFLDRVTRKIFNIDEFQQALKDRYSDLVLKRRVGFGFNP